MKTKNTPKRVWTGIFSKDQVFKFVVSCDGCHLAFEEQPFELGLALVGLTAGISLVCVSVRVEAFEA